MNIAHVTPQEDFILRIVADDGRIGLFDVRPYLDSEAFSPLVDGREFEQVKNGGYFIEWRCGADLSADTIEARWKRVTESVSDNTETPEHPHAHTG